MRERVRRAGERVGPAPLAFAAYLAFALFITWPWVLDPADTLYGVVGDLTSNVAGFQQLAEERQAPFLPGRLTEINAPEGVTNNWALHVAAFGSSTTLWLLSLAIGSVAAHGVVAVSGYTLSAFAMFLCPLGYRSCRGRLRGRARVRLLAVHVRDGLHVAALHPPLGSRAPRLADARRRGRTDSSERAARRTGRRVCDDVDRLQPAHRRGRVWDAYRAGGRPRSVRPNAPAPTSCARCCFGDRRDRRGRIAARRSS